MMETRNIRGFMVLAAVAVLTPPGQAERLVAVIGAASAQAPAKGSTGRGLHIPRTRRVGLTHNFTDGGGFLWDIQNYGGVQRGTNYAYSSGVYCQVNGSNIRSPDGRASLNKKGDELEIGPYKRNNLNCYRRVKVYKDRPLARWVDIFENPTGAPITVQVQTYSNTNWQIGRTITSSKGAQVTAKDWAFITVPQNGPANVPALLHVFASPKSKLRPTVTIQYNTIQVRWTVTVPAGKTVALCYFESQGNGTEGHLKAMKKFNARKLMRDLSPSMRKLILNFPTPFLLETIELDRSTGADQIVTVDGDVIKGRVVNDRYALQTFFGPLDMPAADVIGMAAGTAEKGTVMAALRDGQVVVGKPTSGKIRLKLATGNTLQVPLDRIAQWSYRITPERPEEVELSGPLLVLRTGDRLAFDPASAKMSLRTRHGVLPLPPAALLRIRMDNLAGAVHRVDFLNGSRLAGMLEPGVIHAKLRLGRDLKVPRELLALVEYAAEDEPNEVLTSVKLTNGDHLMGKLAETKLRIQTEFGPLDVQAPSVRAMQFSRNHVGRTTVQLWDGTVLRGQLLQEDLAFTVIPGPTLKLYVGHMVGLVRRQMLAPDEILKQAEKLIPLLGAESARDRDKATAELVKLGPGIVPLLQKYKKSKDAEVRRRIEKILEQLEDGDDEAPPAMPGGLWDGPMILPAQGRMIGG